MSIELIKLKTINMEALNTEAQLQRWNDQKRRQSSAVNLPSRLSWMKTEFLMATLINKESEVKTVCQWKWALLRLILAIQLL